MNMRDLIALVWANLKRIKTRVIMTALGVVIGTAAVVVLVSLGAGLQRQTQESLMSGAGLTQIRVNAPTNFLMDVNDPTMPPGRDSSSQKWKTLDQRAIAAIADLEHVESVIPIEVVMAQNRIEYGKLRGYATVYGIAPPDLQDLDVSLSSGTLSIRHGQAVIGSSVASSLRDPDQTPQWGTQPQAKPGLGADAPDLQGATVRLRLTRYTREGIAVEKTVRLEIVGVLKASGWQHDHAVYIPLRDAVDYGGWAQSKRRDPSRQGYPEVMVRATDPRSLPELESEIAKMGFSVWSDRQQVEEANAYFAKLQAVLAGIGAVALLVAALSIANTMLMAIYERTREIGLMKAVGASNRDVMNVFLTESAAIGLIGGLGGVVVALLTNGLINLIASRVMAERVAQGAMRSASSSIAFAPLWLPTVAVVLAVLVGIVSGAYPARRAANLSPIKALKSE
jgi:putative ABC transport system permease protein